jgi:serine/threonine protein kinase/tetratricopeptide (TPR) repeat protein
MSSISEYRRRARAAARSADYSQSGDFYRLAGDWQKATEMYLRGGHFDLAASLAEEMGDLASASLHYLKAGDLRAAADVELRQENRDKAAWLYSRAGLFAKAAELFESMDQDEPAAENYERSGAKGKAALLYIRAGQPAHGVRLFEELIAAAAQSGPESMLSEGEKADLSRWHRQCGELQMKIGKPLLAAPHFEAALLMEQAAQAWRNGGEAEKAAEIFLRLQRPDDAWAALHEAGKDLSGVSPAVQAAILSRQGKHREAAEVLERAGSLYPASEEWKKAGDLLRAAGLMEKEGETEQAADLYARAGRPAEAAVLMEKLRDYGAAATLFKAAGKHEDAARMLLRAGDPLAAARMSYERGDKEGCIKALQQVKRDSPEFREASVLLGRIFSDQGLFTLAADKFLAALDGEEVSDETVDIYYALGRAHEGNGRVKEALRVYESILASAYGHADVMERIRNLRTKPQSTGPNPAEIEAPVAAVAPAVAADRVTGPRVATATSKTRVAPKASRTGSAAAPAGSAPDGHTTRATAVANDPGTRETTEAHEAADAHLGGDPPAAAAKAPAAAHPSAARGASAKARAAHPESAPQEGRLGAARYVVGKTLGRGRAGEVFRGVDSVLGRPVALRRIVEGPGEAGKAGRLLQAAADASRLSHPHIVPVYDTGSDARGPFIVAGLADGPSLRSLLQAKVRFELHRVVDIGRQIASALEHAHGRGVLHRNLRPENIHIAPDDRVAVGDFGLAVRLSDLTPQELSSGSLIQYTPPEALLRGRVDVGSDLYSLGIILYEMAVGHPPFRGTDIGHQHVNDPVPMPGPGERPLPDFLRHVVLRCLEKDRASRYPDAKALLEDLVLREMVPGMVVSGRYQVLAEIGRGGMGAVFRARDAELDETVAIKVLAADIDAETAARFVQEIKIARSIVHPNVVRVHTFEKWRDFRLLVMEYIDGVALPRWMERVPQPSRTDRLHVALQAAAGLEAAHRAGIVHRDIKPENILVTAAGQAKVLDFGIARPESGGESLTGKGLVLGTPRYMSPEQVQGKPLDRRSDIYSLGAVLFFLFTGEEPFVGPDVRATLLTHLRPPVKTPLNIDPSLPVPLSQAILKALEVDPAARFPTADALAGALARAVEPRAA